MKRREPDPRIKTALHFVEASRGERMTVAGLARVAGLSGSRFSHLFARWTGITPTAYLRVIRRWQAEKRRAETILRRLSIDPMLGFRR